MSKKPNFLVKEAQYFSGTMGERPLPPLPLEDTMNSNLNNDSNLRSLVDNLFQTNRKENTSFDGEDIAESKVRSGKQQTDRDFLFTQMNNITYLLAKICEKVESVDHKVSSVQLDVDKLKTSIGEQSKNRSMGGSLNSLKPQEPSLKPETDELLKLIRAKDEQLSSKEDENKLLKNEIKAAIIDKDILLKLINQLVDSNSENLHIVERELKMNRPS